MTIQQATTNAAREASSVPALSGVRYSHTPDGIVKFEAGSKDNARGELLSNWTARFVEEIAVDDGSDAPRRSVLVRARQGDRTKQFVVDMARLPAVQQWILNGHGVSCAIAPRRDVQSHLLRAIQQASADMTRRTLFGHTGWREVDGQDVYLHGGGAIGLRESKEEFQVQLPQPLGPLRLPGAVTLFDERAAVQAAFGLLDLAPDTVTVAVFAAAWRAPLGGSRLTVWVTGPSGAGKSELSALAQQHYGPGFTADHLPAAWSGTGNALNEMAFLAKDMLLCIDDFVPRGSANAVKSLHGTAETVIRAQGNGAGRSRLTRDAQLGSVKPPRATLLGTGEDVPAGQSLRARMLVVDLGPTDLDFSGLTTAQHLARDGVFAAAMAGYIRWLAAHPERRGSVVETIEQLRQTLIGKAAHPRTATMAAEAALGWRTVLDYAHDRGALSEDEAEQLWRRVLSGLAKVAEQQAHQGRDADPVSRFLELISQSLSAGQAHLANRDGDAPGDAHRWGWERRGPALAQSPWRPKGERIGYIDGDDVLLLPDAAMAVVAGSPNCADPIAISGTSMAKRLSERGILRAGERAKRGTLTVRRTLEDRRQNVWLLSTTALGVNAAEAEN
jgi:hypothetical protein